MVPVGKPGAPVPEGKPTVRPILCECNDDEDCPKKVCLKQKVKTPNGNLIELPGQCAGSYYNLYIAFQFSLNDILKNLNMCRICLFI